MKNKAIFITFGVMSIVTVASAINKLRGDVKRTNLLLEKIGKQIGVPESYVDDELKTLIEEGKKIQAIKMYREISGVGLKEAKEYIDKLM